MNEPRSCSSVRHSDYFHFFYYCGYVLRFSMNCLHWIRKGEYKCFFGIFLLVFWTTYSNMVVFLFTRVESTYRICKFPQIYLFLTNYNVTLYNPLNRTNHQQMLIFWKWLLSSDICILINTDSNFAIFWKISNILKESLHLFYRGHLIWYSLVLTWLPMLFCGI